MSAAECLTLSRLRLLVSRFQHDECVELSSGRLRRVCVTLHADALRDGVSHQGDMIILDLVRYGNLSIQKESHSPQSV